MTAAYKNAGPWTVADLMAMPEDGYRYELVDGRLIVNPLPIVVRYELVGIAEYAIKHTNGAGETVRACEPIPVEFDPAALTTF